MRFCFYFHVRLWILYKRLKVLKRQASLQKTGLNIMSLLIFHHREGNNKTANKGFSTSHTLIKKGKKKKAPKMFPRQRFTFSRFGKMKLVTSSYSEKAFILSLFSFLPHCFISVSQKATTRRRSIPIFHNLKRKWWCSVLCFFFLWA